jgi:hypothetical protein
METAGVNPFSSKCDFRTALLHFDTFSTSGSHEMDNPVLVELRGRLGGVRIYSQEDNYLNGCYQILEYVHGDRWID